MCVMALPWLWTDRISNTARLHGVLMPSCPPRRTTSPLCFGRKAARVLPLTIDLGFTSSNWSNMHLRGAVFLVTRKGEEFHAQWISPVAIFPSEGMCDAESEKALAAAFESGEHKRVTRLHRGDELPIEQCWVRGPGLCLAYA